MEGVAQIFLFRRTFWIGRIILDAWSQGSLQGPIHWIPSSCRICPLGNSSDRKPIGKGLGWLWLPSIMTPPNDGRTGFVFFFARTICAVCICFNNFNYLLSFQKRFTISGDRWLRHFPFPLLPLPPYHYTQYRLCWVCYLIYPGVCFYITIKISISIWRFYSHLYNKFKLPKPSLRNSMAMSSAGWSRVDHGCLSRFELIFILSWLSLTSNLNIQQI